MNKQEQRKAEFVEAMCQKVNDLPVVDVVGSVVDLVQKGRHYMGLCPFHPDNQYLRPEQAIEAVLLAGGIPILAHPVYGNGEQHITGTALRERFRYLIAYGLQGVEAFYTGLSPALTQEVLDLAQQYDLYVTAGSDYHGTNKTVLLGSVPLPDPSEYPQGLKNFLSRIYHP